ncbi:MAG: tetratricopeptide repeat protein [Candidatus Scalinduaceae bacterium]
MKKFLSNSSIKSGKQLKTDGDYPSAITAFTKSIKRKPENLEAYYQLGLIFEEVLHDYDKAISLYENVISLSSGVKPLGTDEELKELNSLITNARTSIDRTIGKKFESIEKPKVPVYIMVKPYQKILKEPKMFSYSIHKTTSFATEFRLLDFSGNWYQINVPNTGQGWVNGKNVLKIIQKEKNAIETSLTGKAALYQRFVDQYPDSRFAQDAKDRADDIHYGLTNEEGTVNNYSMYLRNNPNGKYAEEVRLKMDELTFRDESFFNNIDRLKRWMDNNPESTFIEKAKNRIEELIFAQAKYDNNTVSLERYIINYPDGKFVSEAKQIIEGIKYNQTKSKDTVDSYKKYLDEYPDGKYVADAIRGIDEKEFSVLLNTQEIELLTENLRNEKNEERIGLIKNRIEELSFILVVKTNTKEAYRDFKRKYPQSKYNQESVDSLEVLDFNVALGEDTIESLEKFLITYPNGDFSQLAKSRIEELASKEAKDADTIEAYEDVVKEYPKEKEGRIDTVYVEDGKEVEKHKGNSVWIIVQSWQGGSKKDFVEIRLSPTPLSEVMEEVKVGTRMQKLEVTGSWVKVKASKGDGYIYEEYVKEE